MASALKKAADTVVALVVIDLITASVSLEQAQVETSTVELVSLPELALVLQETQEAEEED